MQVSWIDAEHLNSLLARISPVEKPQESLPADEVFVASAPPTGDDFGFLDAPMHPEAPVREEVPTVGVPCIVAVPASMEPDESDEPAVDEDEQPLHNPGAALPLSRIRDRLRAIRQSAVDAGILTRSAGPVAASSATDSAQEVVADTDKRDAAPGPEASGTRRERLASFASWARGRLQEHGGHIVVMDDSGEFLWGGEGNPAMVLSTMMACGAAIRASAGPACGVSTVIRRTLASGHVLTVIPTTLDTGGLHVAVTAPVALSDEVAGSLRDGLVLAMQGFASEV